MSGITEIGAVFYLVLLLGGASSQSEQKNAQIQFGSGWKIERYAESSKQSQIEEHEDLHLEVEPGWKSGHYAEIPNQYSITEFIREGDDINNWHELLTIQNFASKSWGDPEDAFNTLKKNREQECPGLTKWNVLQKDETSILFESQSQSCLGFSAHHELAKIVDGKYNRFRVAYTIKVYQMPPDKRSEWIDRLSQAEVGVRKASSGSTNFSVVAELERPPADERVVPGYAGETRSGKIQRQVRDLVFRADQKKTATCNTREVVNTARAAPAILEEGKGRRWLHELERWSIDHCGQMVTYYVWYTTDEISNQWRVIVGSAAETEARELEEKEPAFKELRQHEVSGSETR